MPGEAAVYMRSGPMMERSSGSLLVLLPLRQWVHNSLSDKASDRLIATDHLMLEQGETFY